MHATEPLVLAHASTGGLGAVPQAKPLTQPPMLAGTQRSSVRKGPMQAHLLSQPPHSLAGWGLPSP